MPCLGPDGFELICPLEPHTSTSNLEYSGVAFTTNQPARRCPVCGLVALTEEGPTRKSLLVGLALADLGRPSPEAFRLLRLALDLSGAELGQLLGVTPETISHWENGRTLLPRPAWVTLASLAAEALARPATPAAWLRAAADPPRAPKRVTIDATPPAPKHHVWIIDAEDERRETLRFALLLRAVSCKAFRSPTDLVTEPGKAEPTPDLAVFVPDSRAVTPYVELADQLASAQPAAPRVLVFGPESVALGPFANHSACWAGKVRPTDELARRVLDELAKVESASPEA